MVCCGVLSGPGQCLYRKVHRCGHRQRPCRAELLVDGDFNGNLAAPEGNVRDKEIDVALATVVLEDMSAHLLSFSKPWLREG